MVIILLINFGLTFFFSGSEYVIWGIIFTLISVICSVCIPECDMGNKINNVIIRSQIKSWDMQNIVKYEFQIPILKSISFLVLSMKLAAIIGIVIEFFVIAKVFIAILVASGWLIEGKKSGMDAGTAVSLSVIMIKIYKLITSCIDKIVEWLVRLEFSVLGINTK